MEYNPGERVFLSEAQKGLVWLILAISAAFLLLLMGWIVRRWLRSRKPEGEKKKSVLSGFLVVPGCLAGAMGAMQYAVWYYSRCSYPNAEGALSGAEAIVDSLLKALRMFGMEEEYSALILAGKTMMEELAPRCPDLQGWFVVYASMLILLAPFVGGAIVLEIISNVFPAVKLFFARMQWWREKCYFSELNPASLALAKSVSRYYSQRSKKKWKPVLIFTDTYTDDEEEKEYELLLEAKQLGAICVRDDLAHVTKNRIAKSNYFLMDEDEFSNLQTLVDLTSEGKEKYIKNAEIHLFVQSDSYVQIEKTVLSRLRASSRIKADEIPTIIPVNSYRNLIHNLFSDVPLYEPLVPGKDAEKLTVTILGGGTIGTEAFLSAYWMGQMMIGDMEPCPLHIRVVSKEDADTFWSRIDYINPEIRRTTQENHEILRYAQSGETNCPYCRVEYIQKDVKIGGFWDSSADKGEKNHVDSLMDTDYFIVALGSDADNISVANKLRCSVGKKHLESASLAHTVIAYAVYNDELCCALNEQKHFCSVRRGTADVYMHAFGSRMQVYSSENVFMSKHEVWAEETGNAYLRAQGKVHCINENKVRGQSAEEKSDDKNYLYWADLARAMHLKYKVFSLGWIVSSVFDYTTESDCEKNHRARVKEACMRFKKIAITSEDVCDADLGCRSELKRKKHRLAWLEHRRWNAFTRTMGYQCAKDIPQNYTATGSYKHMPLKLHPCLVESRLPGLREDERYILADFLPDGKVNEDTIFQAGESEPKDALDQVSCRRREASAGTDEYQYDFKMYDYYRYEFDDYYTLSLAADKLSRPVGTVEKWCRTEKLEGAVCYDGTWFIPVKTVQAMEKKAQKKSG